MSFVKSKELIEDGDVVLIYGGFKTNCMVTVRRGKVTQIKHGCVKHDELIGMRFGSKYQCARGSITIMAPTPELWSLNLPHRTQILYATDISMITSLLYLQPGFKVIEAGTGSGSLSHSILRTIYPTGHLYTFDFHEDRVKMANQEFKEHKLESWVTCCHRDVCNEGFGMENCADAVFLDLPNPWVVIPFAYSALRSTGSRICCFSPCIEQVQRTVQALQICSFIDVQTIECVNRPFEFRPLVYKSLNLDGTTDSEVKEPEDEEMNVKDECLSEANLPNDEGDHEAATTKSESKSKSGNQKIAMTPIPVSRVAGHTGFLTVATKL